MASRRSLPPGAHALPMDTPLSPSVSGMYAVPPAELPGAGLPLPEGVGGRLHGSGAPGGAPRPSSHFGSTLTAYAWPLALWRASYTTPNEPRPSSCPMVKRSEKLVFQPSSTPQDR